MNIEQANTLFLDGILALSRMEQQGLRIDLDYIYAKKNEINLQIQTLEHKFTNSKFYKEWEKSRNNKTVNIYSPVQLGEFIYKVKKIKINKETITGQGSTDEETLKQLGIPELETLLQIKKLKKIRDTYLEGFENEQVDGYIHPVYNLHLVKTFRSSSSDPNFQNIPKRDKEAMDICRKAIYPRPGHQLMEVDFKQLEVRISATYCNDKKLIEDILEGDMHRDMAEKIFMFKYNPNEPSHKVLRSATKNGFIFPQFYGDFYKNCAVNLTVNWGKLPRFGKWKKGMGIEFEKGNLADHLIENGINDLDKFTEHIREIEQEFWNVRYFRYAKWKEKWYAEYLQNGYFTSKTGFTYTGLMRKNDVMNYAIQGSAFHCLLWSVIEITKAQVKEHWDTRLIGQIHDAIVLDVNPEELDHVVGVVRCIMCNDIRQTWDWITVPLDVDIEICDIDHSWAEKHNYTK